MANICENLLIIRGDTKTIKYFLKPFSSKSNLFDFDKIIPIPESYYSNILLREIVLIQRLFLKTVD